MGYGSGDLGPVTFESLSKTQKPNQVLICPPDLCTAKDVDQASPVYSLSAEVLKEKLLESLKQETNLERVDTSDTLQLRFIQRTPWMRFPDTLRIQLISQGADLSTLALYGQSQIGETDFGVNRERATRWLKRLEQYQR